MPDRLGEVVKALEKAGRSSFRMASEVEPVEVIPTGIPELDNTVLGVGGFPKGKIMELSGLEMSCKTTLCTHVVERCQRDGGVAVWMDAEGAYDVNWGEKAGIDNDKLVMSDCDTGEEGYEIIRTLLGKADLIIVDSIARFIPRVWAEKDFEKEPKIGAAAQMNKFGMASILNGTKSSPKLKGTKTCLVFTNHLISKIGVTYGSPYTTPGGQALKHDAHIRLRMKVIGFTGRDEKGGNPSGQKVLVKCEKNRLAPPLRTCEFELSWDNTLGMPAETILAVARSKGLITVSGSWITTNASVVGVETKFQGAPALKKFYEENEKFRHLVQEED